MRISGWMAVRIATWGSGGVAVPVGGRVDEGGGLEVEGDGAVVGFCVSDASEGSRGEPAGDS